ncbi:MAG TPA: FAD-binding oxidoreductase [Polyangiaceae bacterium]|jgi:glycolate oxidase FAD binding subunit
MNDAELARFAPRPGTSDDAIAGVQPKLVFTPASSAEGAELLAEMAARRMSVAFAGGGTALELGAPPTRLDAVIRTERWNKVLEYAPSDQVVVVEAGVTLAALQRELRQHGQRLAIDPPWPERATLGGIVASNAFGALRTRYGSIRDLLIGATFVRADGVSARGGGKVVKNVAGFDLPKLLVGSLGTLGLITTATFRLHPLCEVEVTLLLENQSAIEVRALFAELRAAQLEPAAAMAMTEGAGFAVALRFEGFRAGVEEQTRRLVELASAQSPCRPLDEAEAKTVWQRHDRLRTAGTFRAKIAALPASIDRLSAEGVAPLLAALETSGFVFYPTLGLGFVSGSATDAVRAAEAIAAARRMLARLGGSLVVEAAPSELRARVDVWGPASAALVLMQSVKARLDPEHRLAPGRFVGGL